MPLSAYRHHDLNCSWNDTRIEWGFSTWLAIELYRLHRVGLYPNFTSTGVSDIGTLAERSGGYPKQIPDCTHTL
jgi:hypothetical protein